MDGVATARDYGGLKYPPASTRWGPLPLNLLLPFKPSPHPPICVPGYLGHSCLSASSPPRWLLYPKPFFEDTPCILEPGEYPTSEAWGTSDPRVGSLKPMRLVRGKWSQVTSSCRLGEEAGPGGLLLRVGSGRGGISPRAGAEGRQGVGHF